MVYTDDELQIIYENVLQGKNTRPELNDIIEPLHLVLKNMEFDAGSVLNIINVLLDFHKKNVLYKINSISVPLIIKICMGKKDAIIDTSNTDYYDMLIKNVLLPSSSNRCDYEHNLPKFLIDFDFLINLVNENCDLKDLDLLEEYNKPLCEIIKNWVKCLASYISSRYYFKANDYVQTLVKEVLTHMATILYINIDYYEYNYDLLFKAFCSIFDNYYGFLVQCYKSRFFIHLFDENDKSEDVIKDYQFAEKILYQTLIPPIELNSMIKRK